MKNHRKIVESVQAGRSAQYLIEVNPLMKKGVFLALLLMLLAAFPALAEDVYYAAATQGGSVTSDKG